MKRTPRLTANQHDALAIMAVRLKTRTLVVDVEPILTTWGTPAGIFGRVTIFAHSLAAELPSLRCLIFATNARIYMPKLLGLDRLGVALIDAACKSWRLWHLTDCPSPITVIGDQVMTDGHLAFRIYGIFVYCRTHDDIPFWPHLQEIADNVHRVGSNG